MGELPENVQQELNEHFFAVAGLAWHDRDDETAELHNQVAHANGECGVNDIHSLVHLLTTQPRPTVNPTPPSPQLCTHVPAHSRPRLYTHPRTRDQNRC